MKSKHYRIKILILFAGFLFPFLGVTTYNIYIDPFYIAGLKNDDYPVFLNRRGYLRRTSLSPYIRMVNMENVIIGASLTANYIGKEVDAILGLKNTVNLTIDASSNFENYHVFKYIINNNKIKTVIMSLQSMHYYSPNIKSLHKKSPLPLYLYDNNRLNDLQSFTAFGLSKYAEMQERNRKKLLKAGVKKSQIIGYQELRSGVWASKKGPRQSFNRPVAIVKRYNLHKIKKLPNNLSFHDYLNKRIKNKNPLLSNINHNLKYNLLPLIEENPDINFIFIIPPKGIWNYAANNSRLAKNMVTINEISKVLDKYSNAKYYGFDNEEFIKDLRVYKDRSHFHIEINRFILKKISEGKNELTQENINQYLNTFYNNVIQWKLPEKWNPDKVKKFSKTGTLTDKQAMKLVYGEAYSDDLYNSVPRFLINSKSWVKLDSSSNTLTLKSSNK